MAKNHQIGLKKAAYLCQMSTEGRLRFFAEGLPILLESAEGFWKAAQALVEKQPREADALEGFAAEEAAKIAILMDTLRCPVKERDRAIKMGVRLFYSHIARLIYAESASWRPVDRKQLREYVDENRKSHCLDGMLGEYIVPTGPIYDRERILYADIEATYEDGIRWSAPHSWKEILPSPGCFNTTPAALALARAMQRLGFFTENGLAIITRRWSDEILDDALDYDRSRYIINSILLECERLGIFNKHLEDRDFQIIHEWNPPMWDFDFYTIFLQLEELETAREANLWREAGYEPSDPFG